MGATGSLEITYSGGWQGGGWLLQTANTALLQNASECSLHWFMQINSS
jgi:hypothetical protein